MINILLHWNLPSIQSQKKHDYKTKDHANILKGKSLEILANGTLTNLDRHLRGFLQLLKMMSVVNIYLTRISTYCHYVTSIHTYQNYSWNHNCKLQQSPSRLKTDQPSYSFSATELSIWLSNSRRYSTNNARIKFKLPAILYSYLDSWLFCKVKKTCWINRLRALLFSICFASPTLWEMSRKTWQRKKSSWIVKNL